jgi:hypothetical protein
LSPGDKHAHVEIGVAELVVEGGGGFHAVDMSGGRLEGIWRSLIWRSTAQQRREPIGQMQLFDLAAAVSRAQESNETYQTAVQGIVRVVAAIGPLY